MTFFYVSLISFNDLTVNQSPSRQNAFSLPNLSIASRSLSPFYNTGLLFLLVFEPSYSYRLEKKNSPTLLHISLVSGLIVTPNLVWN